MKKQVFNPYLPLNEYIPDGEPRTFGNRLYIFGSHDMFDGDYYCQNDYVGWSTPIKDLTDWRYEGVIYRKNKDPLVKKDNTSVLNSNHELNMFAPDVVQGNDGKFYMFYGLDFVSQISVAVSDKPCGEYEYLGVVKYSDGTTYGHRDNDPFLFDPGVLVDDDNKIYLYTGFSPRADLIELFGEKSNVKLKGDGNYLVELEDDMLTIIGEPKNLIPGWQNSHGTSFEGHEFFEASSIRKFNDTYYLIYSSILSHELAYATSKYPDRDFVFRGSLHSNGGIIPGITEEETNYWGNNHGSVQKINNKYYVFGHRQTNYTEFSRQGVAEKLKLEKDGSFTFAEMTSCGLNDEPLIDRGIYSAGIACELYAKNGAIKSILVTEENNTSKHPRITQNKKDGQEDSFQYVNNIKDGTVIGFKYFKFNRPNKISVVTKGTGEGIFKVKLNKEGVSITEIKVKPSVDWENVSSTIEDIITGINSLYFEYEGNGYIDFKEFEFHN